MRSPVKGSGSLASYASSVIVSSLVTLESAVMPIAWDRRTPLEQRRVQNLQLKQTILQAAVGYVPAVRSRLAAIGKDARLFKGLEELPSLPPTSRRDVFDERRNPDGPEGVCLAGSEEGVKRFSDRSTLQRIFRARLLGGEHDAALAIESATRAVHLHLVAGPGGRVPVEYTRDDLDLLARAGNRLAQVLGILREDRIANLVPAGPSLDYWGIVYMALGLGARAIHAGSVVGIRALRMAAADRSTVLIAPVDTFAELLETAGQQQIDISSVRLLVPVGGSLSNHQRAHVNEAATAIGLHDALIACSYGVAEGRVLWGECPVPLGHSEAFGFHTYPDLDVVEVLDPESGTPLADGTAGDVTLTALGFRGGGLPRWRSGDLATAGLVREVCPNCRRTIPRVGPGIKRAAWQRVVGTSGKHWLDASIVAAIASERAADWSVEVLNGDLGGLFVHVTGVSDSAPVIELYQDLDRIGMPPTQIVASTPQEMADRLAKQNGPWRRIAMR